MRRNNKWFNPAKGAPLSLPMKHCRRSSQAQQHFLGGSRKPNRIFRGIPGTKLGGFRGVPGDSEATMRIVSCEKQYKNWYKCKLWQGIPPTELHPFIILKKRFGVFQENVHLRA